MVPFTIKGEVPFENEDFILIRDIKNSIAEKKDTIKAYVIGDEIKEFDLTLTDLTDEERETIIEGCLINYYKKS